MTDLMEFLYSYTLTSRFPGYLNTEDYHGTDAPWRGIWTPSAGSCPPICGRPLTNTALPPMSGTSWS